MTEEAHHGPSYREACEAIAKYWNSVDGGTRTGDQVYNYSPTGELGEIPGWYWAARGNGFVGSDDTQTDEEFDAMLDKMVSQIRPELLR